MDEVPAVHCLSKSTKNKLFSSFILNSLFLPLLVCEYYAHIECQDFAIADCKENATYVPGKDLSSVKHVHHWREGNLPQSSKCASCKKTCWSSECLTGNLLNFLILTGIDCIFYYHLRISLWMVWHYNSRRLSSLCFSRMHFRWTCAHLFTTTCCFDSTNWSADGSNIRCPSEK